MTHAAADVTARFTPEADARFQEYLAHARAALAGCAELSPDEIEQDVRAHVAAEFPAGSGWVRLDQLEPVLARLGRPEQWVSDHGPSSWRRGVNWVRARPAAVRRNVRNVVAGLRHGPDDWRLAYLTLGLLVAGVVIFPLAVVLLPVSYFLARAAVSLARERGTPLGPQRWLVYPPLVLVSLPLLVGLLAWPTPVGVEIADEVWRSNRADIQEALELPRDLSEFLTYTYFMAGALSLWNLIVGVVFWSFPRLPAALFSPFFSPDSRRLGRVMSVTAGAVFAVWLSVTARALPVADWFHDWKRSDGEPGRPVQVSRPVERRPAGDSVEGAAKRVATDFLRACRNRHTDMAIHLADTPFYTGATPGGLLLPDAGPVLRDRTRLYAFLDAQLRQVQKTDQMPADAIRVLSYEAFKALEADAAVVAALDDVLTPEDFVVGVGRHGRETGRVFVRVRDNTVKVVGLTK